MKRAVGLACVLLASGTCTTGGRREARLPAETEPGAPAGRAGAEAGGEVDRRRARRPGIERPDGTDSEAPSPEDDAAVAGVPVPAGAALLEGPYEDPLQQRIRFGERSYYLTPWRAYMDTWPARKFLDCLGCVVNGVSGKEADAVAEVLAEAGIRQVRIEVGWGSMSWEDPSRLKENVERELTAKLRAFKRHGVRALILLNANSGWPCPIREFRVKLVKDAAAGSREIVVDSVEGIKPGYTGLRGQAYQIAFPLVTRVGAATGRCELSAPLKKPAKAGQLSLFILKYRPFAGTVFEDGRPNPSARDTFNGWMKYVEGICRACRGALGTGDFGSGFDLEVWNEYTFGSQFLEIKKYYDPPLRFREKFVYSRHGRTKTGHEAILPMTIDYVNDPANGLTGVRVIDGFSNQRPWESGAGMWPGQAGFSRHYYTGTELREIGREWHMKRGRDKVDGPLNALGERDGERDGKDWHTIRPETLFVPEHTMSLPEYWHHAYQTEFITRDVQPFPGPWKEHHRYSHNGDGRVARVWRTETNYWRSPLGGRLRKSTGCERDDPRYVELMHHVGAKALLRLFVFRSHKGEHTNTVYNAKGKDDGFAVIPEAFFKALKDAGHRLTDGVRAKRGRQLEVIGRVARMMAGGKPIEVARRLSVERLVEHDPRVVFRGDGTRGRPDRYHRDIFACLPFQLGADRFAVGYYVVTRNMLKEWRPEKDALDPARYDMPEQTFDLTLGNVRGKGAKVSAFDPMTGREAPVTLLASSRNALVVRLSVADYPRFLVIVESKPGPLVVSPKLSTAGEGRARLTFSTNVDARAKVTWGRFPERRGDGGDGGGIVELPRGLEHSVEIDSLADGHAVKITVERDGIVATWPEWDWDVRGVARFTGGVRGARDDDGGRAFPPLPAGRMPASWTSTPPPPRRWSGEAGSTGGAASATLTLEENRRTVFVELRFVRGLEAVRALMPAASVADSVAARTIDWGGAPAWQIDLTLDAAAHPGLKERRQRYLVAPVVSAVGDGHLVLAFRGTDENFKHFRDTVDEIARSVEFR